MVSFGDESEGLGLNALMFWPRVKPTKVKSRLTMQAWTSKAIQSSEVLMSEVASPLSWMGRALAMDCSTAVGPRIPGGSMVDCFRVVFDSILILLEWDSIRRTSIWVVEIK